ncbi:C-methyltransferase [Gloeomargarita lithophora Alchichica-D10]|uniref:C-methyltransferase n=1 Tax=Gloeomargarita lithophora Alchichica-D10 TaxID=1188229 RepID=A0A1J0AB60_9CYAN|nr:class I SAM-dependent methyltransferase [Gloeomargarita lithophora]APB33172.1 C-methyltransferase [Gloeomargarita lithophora Alchichica-D10]
MNCRSCHSPLSLSFIDLGTAPPSNALITLKQLEEPEVWFPLKVMVCQHCWLVQTVDYVGARDLFNSTYVYFSSFSKTWLDHAKQYVDYVINRFCLNQNSYVVEIAANDGYLLQYILEQSIPCLGIEPTASTAIVARQKGIPIVEDFFGIGLAKKLTMAGNHADLIVANNVLAHVPDINDFVGGITILLKPEGVVTFEFPYLLNLMNNRQFDTIYHEHFSYLSLTVADQILRQNGLSVFDVEQLDTHGGSLRVFAQRITTGDQLETNVVADLLLYEKQIGVQTSEYYSGFQFLVEQMKDDFVEFLIEAKKSGKTVIGYGAAAKGNTLLNFSGVRSDLMSFIVDRNPVKQGKFTPGSRIPIVDEAHLQKTKPDYIVILPWNIQIEVMQQLSYARNWNAKFVTVIPKLEIQ